MAKSLTNIDRFNITALTLFDRLYDAFPNPIDIETHELGIRAAPDEASVVESVKFAVHASNAVAWLAEEGFIRFEPPLSGTTFRQVRLTLKGLTVLGYLPTAVSERGKPQTVISRIKKVLSGGAEKAGTEAVKVLLTEVFKLATSPATVQAATTLVQA